MTFLFDQTTYEEQRNRWRPETRAGAMDHQATAVEESDVEGILAFGSTENGPIEPP